MTRATSFATVLLLVQFCSSGESADRVPDAQSDSVGGWKRSFTAGSVDASGRLVGGTEHLRRIFQEFTFDIPAGATDLVLRIEASTTSSTEELGIDNIRITQKKENP